jgi:hypothetical protein
MSRPVTAAIGAAACTIALGCSRRDPVLEAPVSSLPRSAPTIAALPVGPRCAALPPPPPTSAARRADCPRALNSDGTRPVLPPSPPSEPGRTVLFRYDDFGPQAMSPVGFAWWSWEPGGSFEICDRFDVRVVVYTGSHKEVARRFPTVKGVSDHRLISRADALAHLDARIAELAAMPHDPDEFDFGPLQRQLEETRRIVLECLPQ